ncbi:MAG: alkaline phosphatase [bacterium]|nr:alkaline phosphatase [bacterium]
MIFTRKMKSALVFLLFGVLSLTLPALQIEAETCRKNKKVKNVILLMYDGQSNGAITCARWYKGKPLAIDRLNSVLCSTYMADSIISGSSAAATAFATGHKTATQHLAVLATTPVTIEGVPQVPEDKKGMPVATLLEGAKSVGKATGLIATAFIQHASTACFSAHSHNRRDFQNIARQQVYLGMDVVLGGGSGVLKPEGPDGIRKDGENLVEVLKTKGYDYVTTREQLLKTNSKKLWGMFAVFQMGYDLDRELLYPDEPSLAEMTGKAIEILEKNPEGFFLFVEGSQVDWASHKNAPAEVITDMVAFDKAVAVALDYAEKHGDTQVFVFSDHDNGGFSIGNYDTDEIDDTITKEMVFGPIKKVKLSGRGIQETLGENRTKEKIVEVVAKYYGLTDLSEKEIEELVNCKGRCSLLSKLAPMLSKRTYIGWTTHAHVGNDVPLFYYGPVEPLGHKDNTDIAIMCSKMMGFHLNEVTEKLFVDAKKAFAKMGAEVRIDETRKHNPEMVAEKNKITVRIPFGKNILRIDKKEHIMPGVAIFISKTGKLYIPRQAVEEVKKKFVN